MVTLWVTLVLRLSAVPEKQGVNTAGANEKSCSHKKLWNSEKLGKIIPMIPSS
jgi:hypothetical protein